jgi:hypothetical protein
MTSDEREPPRANRVLIAATCLTHGGAVNFTNVALTRINGEIELDPHVTRSCILRFDEDATTALHTTLGQ